MSIESVAAQIAALNAVLPQPVQQAPRVGAASATAAPMPAQPFQQALQGASQSGGVGTRIAATARSEIGQTESPPGSNDSPRIAEYRAAVPGGGVGPWCAYFASWVAKANGKPLGDRGEGFARVDDVYAWAQRVGRAVPNGPGARPQPGDLIIWDEHMGIVEAVNPDGTITTVEGNSSDSVTQRRHGRDGDGAIGYVSMS